jgi:16S rRNA (guanine(527)-N(7))-methyltransferase RsmG
MAGLSEQVRAEGERYGLGASEIDALTIFTECLRDAESKGVKKKWKEGTEWRLTECLQSLEFEQVRRTTELADIGSGAGFPGLVLAAALPRGRITLIEQNGSRCEFLRKTAEAMDLSNVEIVQSPVELWQEGTGRFDVVTTRGVTWVQVMMRLAEPLLNPRGTLVVWMKEARLPADGIARSIGFVPSGRYVPDTGKGIFAYTRTDAALPAEMTTAAPVRKQRGNMERNIKDAEEAVARIDAEIADARGRRALAREDGADRLATKIARLELKRAILVERLEIMASWMATAGNRSRALESAGTQRD